MLFLVGSLAQSVGSVVFYIETNVFINMEPKRIGQVLLGREF